MDQVNAAIQEYKNTIEQLSDRLGNMGALVFRQTEEIDKLRKELQEKPKE